MEDPDMATTTTGRWPVWTDGGTGSAMTGTAGPATWVYRLADGTYLTVGPDEAGQMRETPTADRPLTPDGFPIPLQWNRLDARLPQGPATDALAADLQAAAGRPDRDLLRRLGWSKDQKARARGADHLPPVTGVGGARQSGLSNDGLLRTEFASLSVIRSAGNYLLPGASHRS
jgi:hypothetical protein